MNSDTPNSTPTQPAPAAWSCDGESELVQQMRRLRARPSNCHEANALIDRAIAAQIAAESLRKNTNQSGGGQ